MEFPFLAACGATVIILARNLERCQQLAAEINAGGGRADSMSGDVTDEAAMLRVKEEIEKQTQSKEAGYLAKLNWDELDKTGKLKELKEKHPDIFNQKFEEKFGTKPA